MRQVVRIMSVLYEQYKFSPVYPHFHSHKLDALYGTALPTNTQKGFCCYTCAIKQTNSLLITLDESTAPNQLIKKGPLLREAASIALSLCC